MADRPEVHSLLEVDLGDDIFVWKIPPVTPLPTASGPERIGSQTK
jgi:hypothetical protein